MTQGEWLALGAGGFVAWLIWHNQKRVETVVGSVTLGATDAYSTTQAAVDEYNATADCRCDDATTPGATRPCGCDELLGELPLGAAGAAAATGYGGVI